MFGVNVVHDAVGGPQAAWLGELFDTRVRYSGSTLVYFAVPAAITVAAAYAARENRGKLR